MKTKQTKKLLLLLAACLLNTAPAQADNVVGITGPTSAVQTQGTAITDYDFSSYKQFGFGGWDLDNVTVRIVSTTDVTTITSTFYPSTGIYDPMISGDTFISYITDGPGGSRTGSLKGKDWPVGEPTGFKAVTYTDDVYLSNGKPASCLMSTSFHTFEDDPDLDASSVDADALDTDGFLDSNFVNPTMCDSAFQTHKRFKVNALPASIEDDSNGDPKSIDIVLNVEDGVGTFDGKTRYMVLQKLNNYTNKHLKGFKILVGEGVGENFVLNTDGTIQLSDGTDERVDGSGNLTDPTTDIWDYDSMANFSAGLFGPGDDRHSEGFFDIVSKAGFRVIETETTKNEIASTTVLMADDDTTSTYETLFKSKWLPSIYEPKGIFYDDDNDASTDDVLVAWWGDDPNTSAEDYKWLKGAADNYEAVTLDQLQSWATSAARYYIAGIEDVLNLGLTFALDIDDTFTSSTGQFTLRLMPLVDTDNSTVPGYYSSSQNAAPTSLNAYVQGTSAYDNISLLITSFGFVGMILLVTRRKRSQQA